MAMCAVLGLLGVLGLPAPQGPAHARQPSADAVTPGGRTYVQPLPDDPFHFPPKPDRPTAPQPKVLILSTYEPYIPSASAQERGIRRKLARELPYLSVRSDYLLPVERSRVAPTRDDRIELAESLRRRYDGRRPDLLILIDTIAVDLVAGEAKDVFEGVPTVYSGLVGTPDRAAGLNATGVLERVDLAGTIELIRRVQPELREVLVALREEGVAGAMGGFAKEQLAGSAPGVPVRWSRASNADELLAEADTLPPGRSGAVVLMTFNDPGVTPGELGERLRALPRPAYATYATQLPITSVVGGRVIDAEAQGEHAGLLAARVLRGEAPSAIPPLLGAGWVTAANHDAMHRWGIDHDSFPEDVVKRGWPVHWLDRYHTVLLWGSLAALLQAGIIALLVLQRARARAAEAALQAERDRLDLALVGSTQGAWDWDIDTDQTHWSPQFAAAVGLGKVTGRGRGSAFEALVHPDDLPAQRAAIEAHLAGGVGPYEAEFRLRMPDGSYRWYRSRGMAIRDDQGRAVRVAGTISDVHDAAVARLALRESEQRFRAAFERQLLPAFIYDRADGQLLLVNDAMARTYGYDKSRMVRLNVRDLLHPEERPRLEAHFKAQAPGEEHQGMWRHATADGRTLDVLISSIPVPWEGRPGARLVTSIDLTERIQTQRALAERERFIQQIASAVPVVIYVYDLAERRNRYVNRRIEDALGYSPEQIGEMGHEVLRKLMDPADWQMYLDDYLPRINAAKDHEVVEFQYRLRHADGSWRWLQGRDMVLARAADGTPTLMIGSAVDVTDQRQAAERLAASEARLSQALRSGGMGVFDWDIPSGRITWSAEHAEIWGMRLEDFDGSYALFASRVHPEDLPGLERRVQQAMSERAEFHHEYRLRMPDGAVKWVQGQGEFVFDDSGTPMRMVGLVTDVTQRRVAEQALRDSEATNRALLKAVPDLMFRMDRAGRYLDYHAPDPAVLIVTPDRFLGRTAEEVLPEFVLAPTRRHLDALFQTRQPQTFEYDAPPTRTELPTSWEVRMVQVDADTALVLVREITDRRRAERRLEESRQRLSLLIGATPLGVLFTDTSFRILEWNSGAERIFGFSAAEVIGKRADVIIPESARHYVDDIYRQLLANTGGYRGTNKNVRKDGREIFCEWYNSPLVGPDRKVMGVACIVEDVTERNLAQRRQERMLAELDHRVKNNLASVISLAEQTGRSAETYHDFLDRFRVRLRALSRMHTILARSRWEGTDLRALLDDTLEAYGAASRSTVSGPAVTLRPRAAQSLAMALNELATNAAKYGSLSTPAGRLGIAWTLSQPPNDPYPTLELVWAETGGPTVQAPARKGFGTDLIQGTIGFELGGVVDQQYRAEGLVCRLGVPLKPEDDETGVALLESPLRLDGSE